MSKFNARIDGLRERIRQQVSATIETAVTQILEQTVTQIEHEITAGLAEVGQELSGTFQEPTIAGQEIIETRIELTVAAAPTELLSTTPLTGPSLVPLSVMKNHLSNS